MSDLARALVLGAAVAGGVYLWRQRQDQALAQQVQFVPQQSGGGGGISFDAGPVLAFGFDQILQGIDNRGQGTMNTGNSSNTGRGLGGFLADLFGGGQASSGQTHGGPVWGNTGGGASAGGASAGGGIATATGAGGVSRILDLIGRAEAPQGYDQVFGGSRIQPPRPITTMTVSEVLQWQDASVRAGSASSAAGRYQIIRGTLRDLVSGGHVRMSDRFDQGTQDRAALALMQRRGLDDYQAGRMSADAFGNSLAQEWAGLPVLTGSKAGRSYYAGDGLNGATVSVDQVRAALRGGWA